MNYRFDCTFTTQPDRTYSMVIHNPPVSYYLRHAAGIKKGAMKPGYLMSCDYLS